MSCHGFFDERVIYILKSQYLKTFLLTFDEQHQVADIFEDNKFCVQLSVVWAGSK